MKTLIYVIPKTVISISLHIKMLIVLASKRWEEHLIVLSIPWTIPSLLVLKKQNAITLSMAEAKYMATGACCIQILWITYQWRKVGFKTFKMCQ